MYSICIVSISKSFVDSRKSWVKFAFKWTPLLSHSRLYRPKKGWKIFVFPNAWRLNKNRGIHGYIRQNLRLFELIGENSRSIRMCCYSVNTQASLHIELLSQNSVKKAKKIFWHMKWMYLQSILNRGVTTSLKLRGQPKKWIRGQNIKYDLIFNVL